jgi:serine/threonine protein phosphatase 1
MIRGSPLSNEDRRAGPPGHRAYVVGDVHGQLDLLEDLLAKIHAELQHRPVSHALLVFVGDLIDRGPSSAQVIERLRTYQRPGIRPVFLLGNHEEVLLRVIGGDAQLLARWRWFGGTECLESYGVDTSQFANFGDDEAIAVVRSAIPAEHIAFLESFADTCRFGDYLFVHAGIRPGVAIEDQDQSDLRWIREPFLLDDSDHGLVVVHGHTITDGVAQRPNRIGIDTGAYRTGVLTALAIEGQDRWLLDTHQVDGGLAN